VTLIMYLSRAVLADHTKVGAFPREKRGGDRPTPTGSLRSRSYDRLQSPTTVKSGLPLTPAYRPIAHKPGLRVRSVSHDRWSNHDPLDLIEAELVAPAIVKLCCARYYVAKRHCGEIAAPLPSRHKEIG
jgi:hypothetical protein